MKELDWAYMAGFIDADGTISIRRKGNPAKSRKVCYIPHVSISNCDRDVLEWFKFVIGSGAICTKKAIKETHRESYEIRWSYNTALLICKHCIPYLKIKEKQAKILVDEWGLCTPRNGKYTEDVWKTKLGLVKRIRKLNMRGPKVIK